MVGYEVYDDDDTNTVRSWMVEVDDHGEWFLTTDCQTPASGSLHAILSLH